MDAPGRRGRGVGIALGGGLLWGVAAGYEWLTGREGMGGGDIKLHVQDAGIANMLAQAGGPLPTPADRRDICALSVVVHALLNAPDTLDAAVERVVAEAGLETELPLRAARQVQEQLEEALRHGRTAAA